MDLRFTIVTLVTALFVSPAEAGPPAPQAVPAATAPAVHESIVVTGKLEGKAFSFRCETLNHDIQKYDLLSTSAIRHGGGASVSCEDPVTHLVGSATFVASVGSVKAIAADESNGRINVVVPPKTPEDPPFDIITTTGLSRPDASKGKGSTKVTTWDDGTGHAVGSATMSWTKDKNGKAGTVTIEFDVFVP